MSPVSREFSKQFVILHELCYLKLEHKTEKCFYSNFLNFLTVVVCKWAVSHVFINFGRDENKLDSLSMTLMLMEFNISRHSYLHHCGYFMEL